MRSAKRRPPTLAKATRPGGRRMSETADRLPPSTPQGAAGLSARSFARLLLAEQRHRWRHGDRASVETYLRQHPALADDPECLLDLIYNEVLLRQEAGEAPRAEEYV